MNRGADLIASAARLHDDLWRLAQGVRELVDRVREMPPEAAWFPAAAEVRLDAGRLLAKTAWVLGGAMRLLRLCGYVCRHCGGLIDPRRRWDGRCPWCGGAVPMPWPEALAKLER